MPRILFWNINKKDVRSTLSYLCDKYEPEIIVLAESELDDLDLITSLNRGRSSRFFSDLNISKRLKLYTRYPVERCAPVVDENYFSVRLLTPYLGPEIILVAVHLPSKLHAEATDQLMEAQNLAQNIREIELQRDISRTVVIGDFNMSPFEDGMVAANGLHAILDREIAKTIHRTVRARQYPFFYNPMWSRLGDLTVGPPGTHRYSKAVEVNHFWHTFDQILIRPSLIEYFLPGHIEVIDCSGSDHYPIFFNLLTEAPI